MRGKTTAELGETIEPRITPAYAGKNQSFVVKL